MDDFALRQRLAIEHDNFALVATDHTRFDHLFDHSTDHFPRSADHARNFFGTDVHYRLAIYIVRKIEKNSSHTTSNIHQGEARNLFIRLSQSPNHVGE